MLLEGAAVVGTNVVAGMIPSSITHISTTLVLVNGFPCLLMFHAPPAHIKVFKSGTVAAAAALLAVGSCDDHHTPPSPASYTSTASDTCCCALLPPPHTTIPCCAPAASVHSMDDADSCSLGCDSCAVVHTRVMAL